MKVQTRKYRIHLLDGTVIEEDAIGPSQVVAHHPDAWRWEDKAEAERREGGEFW